MTLEPDLFPAPTIADVTLERKIAELRRELAMRHNVYPKLVEERKLDDRTAARRILVLEAIVADYEHHAEIAGVYIDPKELPDDS